MDFSNPTAAQEAPEKLLLEGWDRYPREVKNKIAQIEEMKLFLATAPVDFPAHTMLKRYMLKNGEYISCVFWNSLFHITGTDIVRALTFRFECFGRPVRNIKKFEEGIFSDLRNLKAGTDAVLEEPKSSFLDQLYKSNCIRTQKKQKVFYWYSVPHDRLFLDALERDLKRENQGQEPTTAAEREPALTFSWDPSQSLWDQVVKAQSLQASSAHVQREARVSPEYPQFQQQPLLPPINSMPPPMSNVGYMQNVPNPYGMSPSPYSYSQPGSYQNPTPSIHSASLAATPEPATEFPGLSYDHTPLPLSNQRHGSMPAPFNEYSPAPSVAHSYQDDFNSLRGISYDDPTNPPTPIDPHDSYGSDYRIHNNAGLISFQSTPLEMPGWQGMSNGVMQTTSAYSMSRPFGMHPFQEGSPGYKNRRRRTSLSGPHPLRRSVSRAPVAAVPEGSELGHNSPDSSIVPNGSLDVSRHETPLQTIEGSPQQHPVMLPTAEQIYGGYPAGNALYESPLQHSAIARTVGGPYRRARSATTSELGTPYPSKSHACPIPSCGRLFKRLEHLKRHVRTHTQERPHICEVCNRAFSRSDNLAQHRRTHEPRQDGEPYTTEPEEVYDESDAVEDVVGQLSGQDGTGTEPDSRDFGAGGVVVDDFAAELMPPPSQPVGAVAASYAGF